jgi:hypothetical protein
VLIPEEAAHRFWNEACLYSKRRNAEKAWRFLRHPHTVVGMITILSALASLLPSVFVAAPPWNLSSSPFDITLLYCVGSAQVGFSSSPQTGSSGCGFTEFGRRL